VETIGPEWLTDIDGIEFEADGTLQVTPVGGPLIRYRSGQDIEILAGEGISSANHGYADELQLALIPTGYDNSVIAIRIASRGGR
jgi:putative aminopeptidase FrvX